MDTQVLKSAIIGISIIISTAILACFLHTKMRHNDTISVTGLGETTFTSDHIVWTAFITCDAQDKQSAFSKMEQDKKRVMEYITKQGIAADEIVFSFTESEKLYETLYSDGKYNGEKFVGYRLKQRFQVVSDDVNTVEDVSRSISSLMTDGVDIDSWNPEYYYSKLDDLKLELISKASADAYARAENVAKNAGTRLGKATSANLGVFQITAANGDEEYSYGGTFNTSSKHKKARITVRMTYALK